MNGSDEAKRLRVRAESLADEVQRQAPGRLGGAPCLAARTTTLGSYPTSAASYYACSALVVLGTETEGSPGTIAEDPTVFFALNLGSAIPPLGADLLTTFVGDRWVFRYDG